MKTIRQIILGILLAVTCGSCSVFMSTNRDVLRMIYKGMSKQEVSDLLGEPAYRRFDQNWEEWEFEKYLPGRADKTVIVVRLEDDQVISMDSFTATPQYPVPVASVRPPQVSDCPMDKPHDVYRRAMSEADFQHFYSRVKSKPFKDDQFDMIKIGVTGNGFTCKQCARMMSLFPFDDEKMSVLNIFAPHIVDKINYDDILKELNSLFKKDDAKKLLGIR